MGGSGGGGGFKKAYFIPIGVVVLIIIIILASLSESNRRWYILFDESSITGAAAAQENFPETIRFYFDTSGSMRGFLRPREANNQYVSVLNGMLGDDFKFNSQNRRMDTEYFGYGEWNTRNDGKNFHMGVYRFLGDENTAKANARSNLRNLEFYNAVYDYGDGEENEFHKLINTGVISPVPGFEDNTKHENLPFFNLTKYLRRKWSAETDEIMPLTVITTDLLEQRNNANAFEDIFVMANQHGKSAAMIVVGANFTGTVHNLYEHDPSRTFEHDGKMFFGIFVFGKAAEVQYFCENLLENYIEPFAQDRDNNPVGYEFFYHKNDLITNGPIANFNPVRQHDVPDHGLLPLNNAVDENRAMLLDNFRRVEIAEPVITSLEEEEETVEVTSGDVIILDDLGAYLEKSTISLISGADKSRYVFALPVNYHIRDARQISLSHQGNVNLYEISSFDESGNHRAAREAFAQHWQSGESAAELLLTGHDGTIDPNRLVSPSSVQFFTRDRMMEELEAHRGELGEYIDYVHGLTDIEGRDFLFVVFELNNSVFFEAMNQKAYRLSIGAKPEYLGTDYTSVFTNVRPISRDESGRRTSIVENFNAGNPSEVEAMATSTNATGRGILPIYSFGNLLSAIQKEYGALGDMPDVITLDFYLFASRR
jgi:hypothetical protein